jgi:hypothetical protein
MSSVLSKIESEVNQQRWHKKDAEKSDDLKEDGEFVESEYLGLERIGAEYDQYKKKKEEVDESRQAR